MNANACREPPRPEWLAVLASIAITGAAGCGGGGADTPPWASYAATPDELARHPPLAAPERTTSPCDIVVETPPLLDHFHVKYGEQVDYSSNPASSGPHWPIWASYTAHDQPVPPELYVHDLEHGAIVLLYKCDAASSCADVAAQLESVAAAVPTDPNPACARERVRAKVVVTPAPTLDVPVAAAAWGWTYKAGCFDAASLLQFAVEHYGQGDEASCAQGE